MELEKEYSFYLFFRRVQDSLDTGALVFSQVDLWDYPGR